MNTKKLQDDKLNIISWISQLQDYSIIEKIKILMSSDVECLLSDDKKKAIDEALKSLETKGAIPHNTVMEETRKRFPHLSNR